MARNITVTFDDGTSHVYQNAPDNLTPDMVQQRAQKDFNKNVVSLDGGKAPSGFPAPRAEKQGFLSKLGAGAASLADTTIGGVLPMLGSVVQAGARPFTSPQQAEQMGGAVSSALDKPFGKAFGVTENPAYKNEASQRLMGFIGANINKGADWIAQQTGMPVEDVRNMIGTSMLAVPKVVATVAPVVKAGVVDAATAARQSPIGQMIEQPIQARNTRVAQERSLQSYQNAPRIDAARDALDLGVSLNPAVSNPTTANKLRVATVGSDTLNTKLAQNNQAKFTAAAKDDLGLPQTTTLNAQAFEASRARPEVSKPYETVRNIKSLEPTADTMAQLEGMRVQPLVGDTGQAAAANALLDAVKEQITQGVDGKTLVDSIRARRRDAQAIYNAQSKGITPPAPEAIAKADMNMGVANALENMIESNIGNDPKMLGAFRNARTALAKTYDYERATNFATGQLDPQVIAKMAAEGKPLTGTLAKIGNVAANYPEIAKSGVLNEPNWRETLPRSGVAATIGAATAQALGVPFYYGVSAGAAAGNIAGGALARGMTKPGFQASKAMPPDFRQPIVNNLQPGTSNVTVFDPRNALVEPGEQPYRKTFTGVSEPIYSTSFGQPALPNEVPKQIYQAQKNAERAQEFKAASERKPASGEVILDFDPITGKYRESSQGIKGATPDVLESTGKAAITAAEKVRAGQQFLMSAEEKIQWGKSLLEGMPIDQGEIMFGKLSPQQITNKMADREWVASKITKAREQARAFDDIAKRAADAQAKFDANVKRDQMLDLLTTLEDNLRTPRPTSAGGQGPKTREAIRNKLLGGDKQNNLR